MATAKLTIRETEFDDEARADFWNLPTAKFVGEQARYEEMAEKGILKVLAAETETGERAGTFFGMVVSGAMFGKDGNVFYLIGATSRGIKGVPSLYRAVHSGFARKMRELGCVGIQGCAERKGAARLMEAEGFCAERVVLYKEIKEEDLEDRG